ncbi:hypothetical protein MPTK1_4g00980 [Marchantia polymorpha subsp. ruderalis]|uniref:RWD domain-containing protein n=2 Tax=Marchantia polymorpha TaxID=3197 RepID=A0A176VJM4_MARPO|nr:hypothetical protein AXG93_948s1280 [Marchantia polymorpha subsp. ruderalis]PTQ36087.1 hypothetical protein MARPO_0066s0045 [Marchantia polymorpha]BBN07097.1 hypothetical protein Mp_4g00980 [Marchantia polymorpha subsp. ruderalis]|eukprot:PTQ36087.1 hypothetical protein MARPO_0066s0045 [Marchantia polymorpha]
MDDVVEEELLALESIFYDSYSKINDHRFRLRIDPSVDEGDEANSPPPLFLDIELPSGYPDKVPEFDLANINNSKYPDFVKKAIIEGLQQQASEQLGESMCYALVEWLKEKLPEFYASKPVVTFQDEKDEHEDSGGAKDTKNTGKKEPKDKDKLTKAQKRRFYDKFGANAEKPRGWNWVQIISHLSQVPQHIASA